MSRWSLIALGLVAAGTAEAPSGAPESIPRPPATARPAGMPPQGPAVVLHPADAAIRYAWFTYIPPRLRPGQRVTIWVTGLHGNLFTDDYAAVIEESRGMALSRAARAEEHGLAMLVPVIPRPRTNAVYAVAFAPEVFRDSPDSPVFRPDLKLDAMIDAFTAELRRRGYEVRPRVLLEGFSAGAMFAQRYALLHPERVLALAAGQCGGALTLPFERLPGGDTSRLDWPVGIADYAALVGRQFNDGAYCRVAQFVFIGSEDTARSTLVRVGELWRTQEQVNLLLRVFGRTDPERLEAQARLLRTASYDVTFRRYPGLGHGMTPQVWADVMAFYAGVLARD